MAIAEEHGYLDTVRDPAPSAPHRCPGAGARPPAACQQLLLQRHGLRGSALPCCCPAYVMEEEIGLSIAPCLAATCECFWCFAAGHLPAPAHLTPNQNCQVGFTGEDEVREYEPAENKRARGMAAGDAGEADDEDTEFSGAFSSGVWRSPLAALSTVFHPINHPVSPSLQPRSGPRRLGTAWTATRATRSRRRLPGASTSSPTKTSTKTSTSRWVMRATTHKQATTTTRKTYHTQTRYPLRVQERDLPHPFAHPLSRLLLPCSLWTAASA